MGLVESIKSAASNARERVSKQYRKTEPYHDAVFRLVQRTATLAASSPHLSPAIGKVLIGADVVAALRDAGDSIREAREGSPWEFWRRDDIRNSYSMIHPYLSSWLQTLGITARRIRCRDTYRAIIEGEIIDGVHALWSKGLRGAAPGLAELSKDVEDIRVRNEDFEKIQDRIREAFWSEIDGPLSVADGSFVPDNIPTDHLIRTSNLERVAGRILPFVEEGGESRSFMLVGPPGSGKSKVAQQMLLRRSDFRSVRLSAHVIDTLSNNDSSWTKKYATLGMLVQAIKPDVVILEDLDHTKRSTQTHLLHTLEEIRGSTRWVVATVNNPALLKYALRRPERFDDVIDVSAVGPEEVREILGFDEPLAVGKWPIAYVQELRKRVEKFNLEVGTAEYAREVADLGKRCIKLHKAMLAEGKQVSQVVDGIEDEPDFFDEDD